mgnify:CR=1 FL=1
MTKTITFGIMHVGIAFSVVWLMTGDVLVGGAVALVEPLVNTVGYHFHERVWSGRHHGPERSSWPQVF